MPRPAALGLVLTGWLALVACEDPAPRRLSEEHPLDDVLSWNDAQVVGTHNSYHVATGELSAWAYDHPPLDAQLVDVGVRQFEIDVYHFDDAWHVLHVPVLDAGTTCDLLADCLEALRSGSAVLGPHLPVMVLVEVKQAHDALAPERLAELDALLLQVFGAGGLIVPADLGGTSVDMTAAMADGWPVIDGQRSRFAFVLHDGGAWRDTALAQPPQNLFLDGYGDLDAPWAAFHSMNDPTDPRIAEVALAGHLVRTRADVDTEQARANDTTQLEAALASGAHFVSTDFAVPHPETGYVVEMPEGAPARCNPVTAPEDCRALLVEDPDRLR